MADHVLLGVVDNLIKTKYTSWNVNKVGGKPDWINENIGVPLCSQCQQPQILVAQIYCPLENSTFHRSLYIFCCIKKQCWISSNGWTVCRCQCRQVPVSKVEKPLKPESTGKKLFNTWGDEDDDWEETEDSLNHIDFFKTSKLNEGISASSVDVDTTTNSFQSFQLTGDSKLLPLPEFSFCKTDPHFMFSSYYINVFEENDCVVSSEDDHHIHELLRKYKSCGENEIETFDGLDVNCQERYEKEDVKDKLFHKFWKKVRCFPTQIIRYSWLGSPVLFAESPENSLIPNCEYCGSERVYELQLMPALIPYLQLNKKDSEYVEFGTVLIYSCSKNCWDKNPQKEVCLYFADPDLKYFKSHNV